MTNSYRWQVPGNGNPFDTSLEDWKNLNKFMSQRSIGILFFPKKQKNHSTTKQFFCDNIKIYLNNNFNNPINNSCVTDFYRPLELLGLINRFGDKKNSILHLSLDGRNFLNEIKNKNYDEAKKFLILQMLKTKYPNTAAQDIKLNLFPFRILFKLLLEYKSIDKNWFRNKIPYIKAIEDINNIKKH